MNDGIRCIVAYALKLRGRDWAGIAALVPKKLERIFHLRRRYCRRHCHHYWNYCNNQDVLVDLDNNCVLRDGHG